MDEKRIEIPIWKSGAKWEGKELRNPYRKHRFSLVAYCPECDQKFYNHLFLSFTMHYASQHCGVRVFRQL